MLTHNQSAYRKSVMIVTLIGRELRVAARQKPTYAVRSLGVAIVIVLILLLESPDWSMFGLPLQDLIYPTFFFAGWVVLPFLTADCISRERREHTLELVLLSGATATQIVIAKALVQGLRAISLLVAIVPVLAFSQTIWPLPWVVARVFGMFLLCGWCWPLAAGLLASSADKRRWMCLSGAVLLTAIFGLIFYGIWQSLTLGPNSLWNIAALTAISLLLSTFVLGLAANETKDVFLSY